MHFAILSASLSIPKVISCAYTLTLDQLVGVVYILLYYTWETAGSVGSATHRYRHFTSRCVASSASGMSFSRHGLCSLLLLHKVMTKHMLCILHDWMLRIWRCAEAAPASSQNDTAQPLPPRLTGGEIREKFLAYYESQGHTRLQGNGLVLVRRITIDNH